MLSGFLNYKYLSGETIEVKCASLYEFARQFDNPKALESELMRYISFQEDRIKKKLTSMRILLFFVINGIIYHLYSFNK
jgi:hypothetical protein